MILYIYISGVMVNFIITICIFSNDEFNIIARKNKLLNTYKKIAMLAICFLSWILIIHALIKNR